MRGDALSRLFDGSRGDDSIVAMRAGVPVPFRCLREEVQTLTGCLRNAGIGRVGLWFEDSFDFAVALFACAHSGAAAIVLPNANAACAPELDGQWDVLLSDDVALSDQGQAGACTDVGELEAQLDLDQCRIDFFTSGSTARPKRIQRSLGEFEREVAGLDQLWGEPGSGVTHATVTHQHVYGLVFRLLWPLAAGRVFSTGLSQVWESLLPGIQPADVVISSPAHLTRLGGLVSQCPARLVFSAGAALPVAAARDSVACLGVAPVEIYGSTETGAIASRIAEAPDNGWTALPGVSVQTDDDGLLCLTSRWVEGRHRTADLATIRADGRFALRGRADRVVKVEGKRVSLEMVEAALGALDEVAAVAVVLLVTPRQQLGAAVVLTAQGHCLLEQHGSFRFGRLLRSLLADRLESMARPRRWRFVAALPMAAMGKLPSTAVAALFEDERHG